MFLFVKDANVVDVYIWEYEHQGYLIIIVRRLTETSYAKSCLSAFAQVSNPLIIKYLHISLVS